MASPLSCCWASGTGRAAISCVLNRESDQCPQRESAPSEPADVEHAAVLLRELTRLAASLGSCLDGSAAHVREPFGAKRPQKTFQSRELRLREAEERVLAERQRLAEVDVRLLEQQVDEQETKIRGLRKQILSNNRTIHRLVAYRLGIEGAVRSPCLCSAT